MIGTFSPKGKFCGPIMPKWLLKNSSLSLGAKMLYAVMASCAYDGSDHCWPSQGWLAGSLGISIRSVQNYIAELERLGLIVSATGRAGGTLKYYFKKTEIVELRNHEAHKQNKDHAASQRKDLPVPHEGAPDANITEGYANFAYINNLNKSKAINPPLPPNQPSPADSALSSCTGDKAFLKLWDLWPRKEARASAQREWQKLWFSDQLPPFEQLIQRVEFLQKNDRSWIRGFTPYLINWLRDERWQDTVSPLSETNTSESQEVYQKEFTPEGKNHLQYFRELARRNDTKAQAKAEERRIEIQRQAEILREPQPLILQEYYNN